MKTILLELLRIFRLQFSIPSACIFFIAYTYDDLCRNQRLFGSRKLQPIYFHCLQHFVWTFPGLLTCTIRFLTMFLFDLARFFLKIVQLCWALVWRTVFADINYCHRERIIVTSYTVIHQLSTSWTLMNYGCDTDYAKISALYQMVSNLLPSRKIKYHARIF